MHRRLNRPLRTLLNLSMLLFLVLVSPCYVGATSNGSVSQSDTLTETKRALKGSIRVHLALSPYNLTGVGVGTWGSLDAEVFDKNVRTYRGALEKAIADSGLFSPVERGDPDYVLDVWVEEMESHVRLLKGFTTDMTSVWRVIRVKDIKVLFCDFVDGQGASHGAAGIGQRHSIENATQETIRNGVSALSDDWVHHMSAIQASIRPSMGPVVPEALQWIRQNWPKLRKGMTFDEISNLLDLVAPPMIPQAGSTTYRINRTRRFNQSSGFGENKSSFGVEDERISDFVMIRFLDRRS